MTTTTLEPQALTKKSKRETLLYTIEQKKASFAAVATKYLPPERLIKLAQLVVTRSPALGECLPLSVVSCLMDCSRLGIEPNVPGGMWLIPFKEKGQLICTPIIDYRALIDIARRSGEIVAVHTDLRCEKDEWEFSINTASPVLVHLKHVPEQGEPGEEDGRGQILGAYFVAKLQGGQCHAAYLTAAQIEKYRARSRAGQSDYSPWVKDWPAMAMKTACRRGVNLLPRSPEIQQLREALEAEEKEEIDANAPVRAKVKAATATVDTEFESMLEHEPPHDAETGGVREQPKEEIGIEDKIDAAIEEAQTGDQLDKAIAGFTVLPDGPAKKALAKKIAQKRQALAGRESKL